MYRVLLELAEIDASDHAAVHDEQKAVAEEKVGEDGVLVLALNDGVDRVADGFEAVEALDLADDRRRGGVERAASAKQDRREPAGDAGLPSTMKHEDDRRDTKREEEKEAEEDGAATRAGARPAAKGASLQAGELVLPLTFGDEWVAFGGHVGIVDGSERVLLAALVSGGMEDSFRLRLPGLAELTACG